MTDKEIAKRLPRSFQVFARILEEAGLKIEEIGDENKDETN